LFRHEIDTARRPRARAAAASPVVRATYPQAGGVGPASFAGGLLARDLLAQSEKAGVVGQREDEPLLACVVDRARADLVEIDEQRARAVELAPVARHPLAHAERLRLLRSRQDAPEIEVLEPVPVELGERQDRGHARGVVVGARHDPPEDDVEEQRDAPDERRRGHELSHPEQRRLGEEQAHEAAPEEQDQREEEDLGQAEGPADARADPRSALDAAGAEDSTGVRGVVVGEQHEHARLLAALSRDDVLRGALRGQTAKQEQAACQVAVGRDRCH
jgi:hypothetical protein